MTTKDNERSESLFDELVETAFSPDGEVEVKTVEGDAKEMQAAADDLVDAWARYRDYDRSPRSVRQHDKFRRTLLLCERYRADA